MKKILIYAVVILWAMAGLQIWNTYNSQDEEKIVEAFHSSRFKDTQSQVEAYGLYKGEYLSARKREKLVKDIASKLKITDGFEVTDERSDGQAITKLSKRAKKASTVIRIVTSENDTIDHSLETKQYIFVDLTIFENLESAVSYRKQIDNILSEYIVDPNTSLNLTGSYAGPFTLDRKNEIADELMNSIDVEIVSQHRSDDLFTIYGYTKLIQDFEVKNSRPINVNLAFNYDEESDRTNLYLSTPIINKDY